jgi:hypothetical protein
VAEVAVALVNLDLAIASFTWLLQIGVLVEAGIASFLGHGIEASSQLFSGFEASGGALDVALDGLEVVLGGEATCCIGSGHYGGHNGFHLRSLEMVVL